MPSTMTGDPTTPPAWANLMVRLWGKDRFPIDVKQIALEYSKTRYPNDPIHNVQPASIKTFEGALMPLQKRGGWAILYNPSISSAGRINYTLGHEYGHYLCHRLQVPGGFECGQSAVLGQAGKSGDREREADKFASYLLMPFDDYRTQVGQQAMSLDILRHCADRYDVSLTAAALRWIEYTPACAVVVVSINGFVLWCRRIEAAMKSRLFFPKGMELPVASLTARGDRTAPSEGMQIGPGVWSPQHPVREMAIFADQYEMAISLLVFDPSGQLPSEWRDDEEDDLVERMARTGE
jgi:hypothetical protein